MGIYLKQWTLVQETSEYSLRRITAETFTRAQAERLQRQWAETWPDKSPLIVVNLLSE